MARKKHDEEHENHERWLVSYADFITLLFAFFVVMYSVSQVNEGKYRVLSDALLQAFKPEHRNPTMIPQQLNQQGPDTGVQSGMIPRLHMKRGDESQRRAREQKMRNIARDVLKALEPLVKEGQVRVTESARGIAVEINASVLFKSAQATLEPESIRALTAVARVLAGTDNAIEVEGHTDREPISTAQFPSNWELSGARASSVVRLFIDNGVAPRRLVAAGYADTRPVDTNDTPDGRTRNRRVTVMIRADEGEPGSTVSVLQPTAPAAETDPDPAAPAQGAGARATANPSATTSLPPRP
jgi:chemotaxis protein MotB